MLLEPATFLLTPLQAVGAAGLVAAFPQPFEQRVAAERDGHDPVPESLDATYAKLKASVSMQ